MSKSYSLVRNGDQVGIRCTKCRLTSWNPYDVQNRFCGACHTFHRRRAGNTDVIQPASAFPVHAGASADQEAIEWKTEE